MYSFLVIEVFYEFSKFFFIQKDFSKVKFMFYLIFFNVYNFIYLHLNYFHNGILFELLNNF
jgi:hypothetical protein